MRTERELGHDAEVAAAAAHGPEELGVLVGARRDELVRRPARPRAASRLSIVRPYAARQVPDAAAERQPADAGRGDDPARDGKPVRVRGGVDVGPGASSADANRARVRHRPRRSEQREIGHDAVVDAPEAAAVVAAAAHRQRQVVRAREGDQRPRRRPALAQRAITAGSLVDHRVEQSPRLVVARVVGPDQLALERCSELAPSRNCSSFTSCSSCYLLGRSPGSRSAR